MRLLPVLKRSALGSSFISIFLYRYKGRPNQGLYAQPGWSNLLPTFNFIDVSQLTGLSFPPSSWVPDLSIQLILDITISIFHGLPKLIFAISKLLHFLYFSIASLVGLLPAACSPLYTILALYQGCLHTSELTNFPCGQICLSYFHFLTLISHLLNQFAATAYKVISLKCCISQCSALNKPIVSPLLQGRWKCFTHMPGLSHSGTNPSFRQYFSSPLRKSIQSLPWTLSLYLSSSFLSDTLPLPPLLILLPGIA